MPKTNKLAVNIVKPKIHKLLSSESTIRTLTYQNKQLKTEQPLNQTFFS